MSDGSQELSSHSVDDHCYKVVHKCYAPCTDCPDVCPKNGTLVDRNTCVADNQPYFSSAAMEYKPFCREFYRVFSSTTAQYIGVLLGNCIVGVLADRFGRRLILLIALCLGLPNLALSAFFNDIVLFYLFRFLVGISVAATMTVGWAYCAEMISPEHRFKLRTFTSWTNGRLIMTALSHLAHTWRLATYYHATLSLGALLVVFLLPESPLWLKSKGYHAREEKARKVLAHINGVEYKRGSDATKQPADPQLTLKDVFKDRELRKNLLVLCVMWFCAGLSMYMIDLNGEDMTKNFWLGQYISAILASAIRVIFGFADAYLPWLGRRKVYILSMSTCILASAGLTIQLYSGGKGSTPYFITYIIAYNSISVSWEPNFLGAVELMPTHVRGKTTAMLNIIARLSNVLASQMIYFKTVYEPIIMIVLMISNISSFLVTTVWLKETKNIDLEGIGKQISGKSYTTSSSAFPEEALSSHINNRDAAASENKGTTIAEEKRTPP